MVLLEEYFELHEKENVSKFWKAIQIVLYVNCGVFGLWCGYTIAILRITFNNNCYLFGRGSFERLELQESYRDFEALGYIFQDAMRAPDTMCDYCQYTMISSFICSTIWLTFFIMCGKGGKSMNGLSQPWRIVLPATIFNLIYCTIIFVAALQIHQGTNLFCQREIDLLSSNNSCMALNNYDTSETKRILFRLQMSVKTAWVTVSSWFLAFLISLFRIILVSDFYLYKISVYSVDDLRYSNEEVLEIVDYNNKQVWFEEKSYRKSTK